MASAVAVSGVLRGGEEGGEREGADEADAEEGDVEQQVGGVQRQEVLPVGGEEGPLLHGRFRLLGRQRGSEEVVLGGRRGQRTAEGEAHGQEGEQPPAAHCVFLCVCLYVL